MPYYRTKDVGQETLEPKEISFNNNDVNTVISKNNEVWHGLDFYQNRNLNNDVLVSKYTGWYQSTSRYIDSSNLIAGNKYVYLIVTSGETFGTATTWSGNRIEQRGYNDQNFGSWSSSLTWSMIYSTNNSTRGRIGGGTCSKTFQGTFIASETGSSLIATMGFMSDNKTPSYIKVFDYNLVKNIFNKAGLLENFYDEVS